MGYRLWRLSTEGLEKQLKIECENVSIKELVTESKKQRSPIVALVEQQTEAAAGELQKLQITRMIAEEKAAIRKLGGEGAVVEPSLATGLTSHVFQMAGVDPGKAKQFLDSLGPEEMNKIATLMAFENDKTGSLLRLAQSPTSDIKNLVEIVKLMRPDNGGVDLKGIAEVFKAGVEAAKSQAPAPQQDPMQTFKYVMDTYVAPFQKTLSEKDDTIWKERMDKIASQNVNPLEWFKNIKEVSETLGFKSSGAGEIDLKLEDMRQMKELDMERLKWEQQKYILEKEADKEKYQMIERSIKTITEGPLGKALEKIGGAGADRLRGAAPKEVKTTKINCPNCGKEFWADAEAPVVVCGSCGVQLSKVPTGEPSAPATASTPTATQSEASKQSEPAAQPSA